MPKKVTPRLAKSEVPGVFQMQYQKQSDAHAIYQNGNALSYYRNRLRDLALVRYVYDFGDSVPLLESSRLNLMLYNYKELAIARADSGDLVILPYTLTDIKTIYGYPSHVRIYSPYTTFHIERDYEEIALIRDNISSYSTASIVEYFATSLYIIDRTISVNLYNQKTPVLIVAENDAQKLAVKKMFKEISDFEPAIAATSDFTGNNMQVLPVNAPFLSDKLYDIKLRIWKEALSALGIPSTEGKKERSITGELVQNIGEHVFSAYTSYLVLKEGFDRANRLFGTNLTVKYNDTILEDSGFDNLFLTPRSEGGGGVIPNDD